MPSQIFLALFGRLYMPTQSSSAFWSLHFLFFTSPQIASCMTVVVLTSMTAYVYFYSQNMILEAALQPVSSQSVVCFHIFAINHLHLFGIFIVSLCEPLLLFFSCTLWVTHLIIHVQKSVDDWLTTNGSLCSHWLAFSARQAIFNCAPTWDYLWYASMETVWQILLYVLMSVLLWLPSNVLYMRTRFDFLRTIVRLTFPIQVPLKVFLWWNDSGWVWVHWFPLAITPVNLMMMQERNYVLVWAEMSLLASNQC